MEFTAEQVAGLLNGKIDGDKSIVLKMVGKIETAGPSDLAFLSNPTYEKYLYTCNAGAVLVAEDFNPSKPVSTTLIRVKDPYLAFTSLLREYGQAKKFSKSGIEKPSFCSESAQIGKDGYLGAFSYIGNKAIIGSNVKIYPNVFVGDNVVIGDNCIMYPGVKIYDDCQIGSNVTLHSGAIIGSDGFGFAPKEDGTYDDIPQLGNVTISNNVSIGANTIIDRATLPGESTIIEEGVKLDNLIQIAHNVTVGAHTVIAAQSGVSGSSKIGKYCLFGGQVGIAGHLTIADKTHIGAQAGIPKSIKTPGQKLIGYPAFGITDYFKSYSIFKQLPEISKRLKDVEEKVLNLPEF